ncbi:MAG: signal recognition particle receptor subunit alpha, partial [Halobacterium sp.]
MFDGLKDKLSNFREDAEEVAEENAEALDSDEAAAEAGAGAEAGAEAGEPVEAEAGAGGEGAAAAEAQAEAADSTGEDESSSGGFVSKASSLARGRVVIEEDDLDGPLRELEFALLESDVEMSVAEAILDQIRDDLVGEEKKFTQSTGALVEDVLRDALLSVIDVDGFDFEDAIADSEKPVTVVFTGVNGVGKTTTIAKLGKRLEDHGYSVVLANGDTYRAGANEQLQEHADNL